MKKTDFSPKTLEETAEILRGSKKTLLLCHRGPDGDAIGSALALVLMLRALGGEAIAASADEAPQYLRFLLDGVQDSLTFENIPSGFEDALVVAVDTASPAQLGALAEPFLSRVALMIDHHGTGEPFADYLVCPHAAATGEVMVSLAKGLGVSLSPAIATLLYAAISADTGCFRYSNVTRETHLAAAELVDGIDAAEVNRQLFEVKSIESLRAEKAGFERLSLYEQGRVGIITFPRSLRDELLLLDEHLSTLIDVARAVRGVEVAAAIRETDKENTFRASLRANVDFDVSAVAAAFGGGGHRRAAGVTLVAESIELAAEMLLSEIQKQRQK